MGDWVVLFGKNRPFASSSTPLYQNKVKCSAFEMEMISHSHEIITHIHKKGAALGLILKVRVLGTQKWPFCFPSLIYCDQRIVIAVFLV